mmetsp:Transcript_6137/g.9022  ORF Transcript_6137/g.9022 Transcript_6137/m.9022 type:complete len:211 (-) Transcript_6137:1115-1747(-)
MGSAVEETVSTIHFDTDFAIDEGNSSCGQWPALIGSTTIPLLRFPSISARPFASFRGSNKPCATKTGPLNIPSSYFEEFDLLLLDDPKSAPSSSFAVRGGGNLLPEIITFIAPGSRESRRIPLHKLLSTASGFVGYKFMHVDWIRGLKYQSNPSPPMFAIFLDGGLVCPRRSRAVASPIVIAPHSVSNTSTSPSLKTFPAEFIKTKPLQL